jgi:hypothetical protein
MTRTISSYGSTREDGARSGMRGCVCRQACALRMLLIVCTGVLVIPRFAHAQGGLVVELRIGAMASTPLVVDTIVRTSVLRQLGITNREATGERVTQAVSPTAEVSVRTMLQPALSLEAVAGYTLARLHSSASDANVQNTGVPHAGISLRYEVRERLHVRGGFGGLRYGEGSGMLRDAGGIQPMIHGAAGATALALGRAVSVELFVQGHSFGTPALRRAGGTDGRVLRFGVRGGAAFGGMR